MECLREGWRNSLSQVTTNRNGKAQPTENQSTASGRDTQSLGWRATYYFVDSMANRCPGFKTENKSRNVTLQSQYAIQELRTIYIQ